MESSYQPLPDQPHSYATTAARHTVSDMGEPDGVGVVTCSRAELGRTPSGAMGYGGSKVASGGKNERCGPFW